MALLEDKFNTIQRALDAACCIACGTHMTTPTSKNKKKNVVTFFGSNPTNGVGVSTALACCCDSCKNAEAFAQKLCTFVRNAVGDFKLYSTLRGGCPNADVQQKRGHQR